jgi:hypothetical protein
MFQLHRDPVGSNRVRVFLGGAVLSLLVAACGGSAPAAEAPAPSALTLELAGAPEWVSDCTEHYPAEQKVLCGVGSVSGMTNPGLARSAAEGRARTAIARGLQLQLAAMLKDYQASTEGGASAKLASEQHIEDTARQITSMTLSGTRMDEHWISQAGTYYALVILDVQSFKGAVSGMAELDESTRAAIVARADKSFAELDAATKQATK